MLQGLAAYYAPGELVDGTVAQARDGLHPVVQDALGLDPTKALTNEQLANLLNGKRTDGLPVPGKAPSQNTFIDFVFSAPKSFSVALVMASPAERALLEKAFNDAADQLMDLIAERIGTASVGKTAGNRASIREPAHVAIVPIDHYSARPTSPEGQAIVVPGDPHRHKHMLFMNAAFTDEGRVTSVYQEGIDQRVHEWGAIGQAFLATNLRKLGVNVELDSAPGLSFNERMARLTDVPRWVCDLFSKRNHDAERAAREYAQANGFDFNALNPEQRASMLSGGAAKTRLSKVQDLREYDAWHRQAADAGYRHRSVLRPDEIKPLRPATERQEEAYRLALPMLERRFETSAVLEGSVPRAAAAKALIATGIADAREVNVITAAMRSEGVTQDGQRTELHWAIDSSVRYARVTTQMSVDQETEAVNLLKAAAADKSVAIPADVFDRAVVKVVARAAEKGKTLDFTKDHGGKQLAFARQLSSAGRAAVGIGAAGSGKSTALEIPVTAWHDMGRETIGIATAWRQTEGMRDAGIGKRRRNWQPNKSALVDAGIAGDRVFSIASFKAQVHKGKISLSPNTTVVVDEVGLIGTKDILDLARLQAKHGFHLVKIGDDAQCQAVSAGAPVDLCRRAYGSDNVPELLDSIRQETARERETTLLWRQGRAEEALRRKDEDGSLLIVPGGYSDAVKATVDLWWQLSQANAHDPQYTIGISVPTNADARAIGEAVRLRRREAGELGARDLVEIDATDQNGEKYSLRLAAGDHVRLFDRVYGLDEIGRRGVVGNNGSVVEVVGADAERLTVRKANGKTASIAWDDLREDAHERRSLLRNGVQPASREGVRIRLSYGDAVTINARQSETLTDHITAMPGGSAGVTGFTMYTADSRQRRRGHIVTSHGAENVDARNHRPLGHPDNHETDTAKVRGFITANMARNLARQPKKILALELLDNAIGLRRGTLDARLASWFKKEQRQVAGTPTPTVRTVAAAPAAQPQAPPAAPSARPAPQTAPAPAGKPPARASKPKPATRPQLSPAEVQAEFARELERMGLRLDGPPIMDGQKHTARVDGNKRSRKSGFYRGHADGRRTSIAHNSKTGETIKWRPAGASSGLTAAQREAQRESDRLVRLAEQAARRAKEANTAAVAAAIWNAAEPADPSHPYLQKKQIPAGDLRQGAAGQVMPLGDDKQINLAGRLIVPLRDEDGTIWNIQAIGRDGGKLFLSGRKKGLSFTIGEIDSAKPILIGEGVATMGTLHNTTALTSVAAIDSGNLYAVAASLRTRYPETALIFAADNDHHLPRRTPPLPNVGLVKARDAADAVGGVVVAPQFHPADKSTDWNDMRVTQGEAATRRAIEQAFHAVGIAELMPPPKPAREPRTAPLTHEEREAAWSKTAPIRRGKMPRHAPSADRLDKRPPTQRM